MLRTSMIHALAAGSALAALAPDGGGPTAAPAAPTGKNKSIFALLKGGQISFVDALMRSEVWFGQTIEKAPGGKGLITFLSDLVTGGARATATPLTALATVIEAPVDVFLVAKLGPLGALAEADFNAAVQEAVAEISAYVQLQASDFAANLKAGAAKAAPPAPSAPASIPGGTQGSPS